MGNKWQNFKTCTPRQNKRPFKRWLSLKKKTLEKMSTKSNTQKVNTFIDQNTMSIQEVNFDSKDQNGWLNVIHDGNELNLTLENWNKLNELVQITVNS